MAVKAKGQITLSSVVDVKATYRYYLLQSSTLEQPEAPKIYPPTEPWIAVEPSYNNEETNSLYLVDCTLFCDDTFIYSKVSLSSTYEAAKEAYNRAINAQNTADSAKIAADEAQITGDIATEVANGLVADIETIGTTIEELNTQITQTDESWRLAISETRETVIEVDGKIDEVKSTVDSYETWFDMSDEGLVIGKTEDGVELPLKVRLDNDSLDFLDGDTVVAYVSNEKLMINATEVKGSLDIGSFRWTTRANGNMGLMWIGGQ